MDDQLKAAIKEAVVDALRQVQFDCWMTKKEVASYLRMSVSSIESLMRKGQIPYRKVTGKPLFRKSEIDEWVTGRGKSLKDIVRTVKDRIA